MKHDGLCSHCPFGGRPAALVPEADSYEQLCYRRLTAKQRNVLALRWQGVSEPAIAARLGMSRGAVQQQFRRVTQDLVRNIGHDAGGGG